MKQIFRLINKDYKNYNKIKHFKQLKLVIVYIVKFKAITILI